MEASDFVKRYENEHQFELDSRRVIKGIRKDAAIVLGIAPSWNETSEGHTELRRSGRAQWWMAVAAMVLGGAGAGYGLLKVLPMTGFVRAWGLGMLLCAVFLIGGAFYTAFLPRILRKNMPVRILVSRDIDIPVAGMRVQRARLRSLEIVRAEVHHDTGGRDPMVQVRLGVNGDKGPVRILLWEATFERGVSGWSAELAKKSAFMLNIGIDECSDPEPVLMNVE